MNKNNKTSNTKFFILGAMFGALVSTIASLLFAPKSGKDLRRDLEETTSKTLESTDEYLELARQKGSKALHDMEDVASTYFSIAEDKMKSTFTKTEEELDKKVDGTKDYIDDKIDELEE